MGGFRLARLVIVSSALAALALGCGQEEAPVVELGGIEITETMTPEAEAAALIEMLKAPSTPPEMKVLIAGQAALLLLGLELDDYPELTSMIVHRSTVRLTGPHATGGGTYSTAPQLLAGQAHSKGPVILSWGATRQGAKSPHRGENVVYHEFAHRLDMLDGIIDGTPPLGSEAARKRWVEVCTTAYDEVRAEGSPVLRPYAGTNPAEFFAVATEVFFTRSVDLRDHEPDLYEEFRSFYNQDPAERHHRDGH